MGGEAAWGPRSISIQVMVVLGIIFARAGSKGLPDKCVRELLGKPVIGYTFDHAAASRRLTHVLLTTDSAKAQEWAKSQRIKVVERPAELAGDTATIDAAARHAVLTWEQRHASSVDVVVLLYGNIPLRAEGLVDRAVDHLLTTGADSVRSVAPVTKQHPDWVHRLDGDRMIQFRSNSIYRRQDLEPLYYHDGAVAAVTRTALFAALNTPDDHQSFLGRDRRAIVQRADETVDIDEPIDFHLAEALLRHRDAGTRAWSLSAHIADERNGLADGGRRDPCSDPHAFHLWASRRGRSGVMVVAEAGVNHNGHVEEALSLVDVAHEAGADAVKFQIFRAESLVTATAATADYQMQNAGANSQKALLSRLELTDTELHRIRQRCHERDILFVATAFTPADVQRVVELDPAAIKIASTDVSHPVLLRTVAGTGLPVILSTGASTAQEISQAVAVFRECGAHEWLVLLHCVSAYPTPLEALNLRAISSLRIAHGVPCGLSDHSLSLQTGGWAVAAGACMLEKHFTLECGQIGPDHAVSLNPAQLAEYIRNVREAESALGSGAIGLTALEADVRRIAGKSIVVTQDVPAGTVLTGQLMAIKRPGGGIAPSEWERVIGRRARVSLPSEVVLTWDLVR